MLGSLTEAEDAVQETWLRLNRSGAADVRDMRAWLTTVVSRVCLDMLRSRATRREDSLDADVHLPDPIVTPVDDDPAEQAILADSVGIALLVVLDTLSPGERLAFVLHDVFAMPFAEIAQIMERTPNAARQLASRARQRVQAAPQPDSDLALQRRVVDAFLAAARAGDFDALLAMLHADVVFRFDLGPELGRHRPPLTGADAVNRHLRATAGRYSPLATTVLVNGAAGWLIGTRDDPIAVFGFTIVGGRVAALDLIKDPAKLRRLRVGTLPREARRRRPEHTWTQPGAGDAHNAADPTALPAVGHPASHAQRDTPARPRVTPKTTVEQPDFRHHCSCSTSREKPDEPRRPPRARGELGRHLSPRGLRPGPVPQLLPVGVRRESPARARSSDLGLVTKLPHGK
jgi:RNA polymerase sigma-70 factor (ECF subfamily)